MVRGFWFFSFKKLNYLSFWFWLWFWNLKFDEWYEDFDFEWKICSLTSDWWALVLKKKGSICLSTLNAPYFNTNTIDFNRWFQSKVRWCVHWQGRLTNYRKGYETNSTEKKQMMHEFQSRNFEFESVFKIVFFLQTTKEIYF